MRIVGFNDYQGGRMAVWPRTVPSPCRSCFFFFNRIKIHDGLLSIWEIRSFVIGQLQIKVFAHFLSRVFHLWRGFRNRNYCERVIRTEVTHAPVASVPLLRFYQPGQRRNTLRPLGGFIARRRIKLYLALICTCADALVNLQNCPDKAAALLRATTS